MGVAESVCVIDGYDGCGESIAETLYHWLGYIQGGARGAPSAQDLSLSMCTLRCFLKAGIMGK
jgi:hypothetical protein